MKNATIWILVALLAGAAGYGLGLRAPGSHVDAAGANAPITAAASAPRRLLYYRNPMGLADTSPTPKKDPMGMDYIAVYEGEEPAAGVPGAIVLGTEKVQKLGVRTEAAGLRPLARTVRAAGRIEADERRVFAITPKFEGYVERLHVNVTGQSVAKGQALFEVYSPELLSAQQEYAAAMQGVEALRDAGPEARAGMRQLADASLARLRHWDLPPEQVAALVRSGEARRSVTFRSPVAGVVTEKKAVQGMRFMPGELLYQITDLSSVWVLAEVAEQDIGLVRPGASAQVLVNAYPAQRFAGRIAAVYPGLATGTRTVPVRIELPNPGQQLKPGMFAQVELAVGAATPVLTVPDSAVIDSGTRRIVLVQTAPGRFEPREVQLGARDASHVEVLEGLREGEQVVVAANFLIDAESNLKAALGGLGGPAAAAEGSASAAAAGVPPRPGVGHRAEGRVEAVDARTGTLTLQHGEVASLQWPPMTMPFKVANPGLLQGLQPGQAVRFEFVERQRGEYVVTAIEAVRGGPAAASRSER